MNNGLLTKDLRYKDCRLLIVRNGSQKVWRLDITARHQKGRLGEVPNTFSLWEQKLQLFFPITLFVTLAIADGAFSIPKSLFQLQKIKITENKQSLVLSFTESVHELPVFHGISLEGHVVRTGLTN